MSKYAAGYMDQGLGHGHWKLCHADTMQSVTAIPVEDALKMAAAEELYEALQNLAYLEGRISPPPYGHHCRWCGECTQKAKDAARAALAKAEGKQEDSNG